MVALSLRIILCPVMLIVKILLLVTNEGKPFFFQDRPGYRENKIRITKFKSMTDKKDSGGKLLTDNERITTMVKFIRSSSFDEL